VRLKINKVTDYSTHQYDVISANRSSGLDYNYLYGNKNVNFYLLKARFIPYHPNLLYNYVNVEIFHKDDVDEKDCLGWITVSSRAECDLAPALQQNKLDIEERKCIIIQLENVLNYLLSLNLIYFDLKGSPPPFFRILGADNFAFA